MKPTYKRQKINVLNMGIGLLSSLLTGIENVN